MVDEVGGDHRSWDAVEPARGFVADPSRETNTMTMTNERLAYARDRFAAHSIVRGEELRLWYQPVVRIADRTLAEIEALVRWAHPSRGLLTPDTFLPEDRSGQELRALDEWALTQACVDFVELRDNLGDRAPNCVAVNVSPATVSTEFDQLVEGVIAETGLAASQLVLELSEDIDLDALIAAVPHLERLSALGVHLILDDVGSGATTPRHLSVNAISGIKIDRAFVNEMLYNDRQHTVVELLADLGRHLSLPVIAEGVETAAQLAALAELDITHAQGYHVGRPEPISALSERLASLDRRSNGVSGSDTPAACTGGQGAAMTATLPGVAANRKRAERAAEQQAADLVRLAKDQGLSLTGPDGLLKQLTKTVLETALQEAMTEHLGYDRRDPAGAETGNVRNGTRSKTVLPSTVDR
jgi:EAL domain-containing protein (putative c-di-GMP-specific phosphodiesterase class I)